MRHLLEDLLNHGIGLVLLLLVLQACDPLKNPFLETLPDSSRGNKAPDTHLFLNFAESRTDTVISETTGDTTFVVVTSLPDTTNSLQVLYWWGEDEDGDVVAYHTRWSYESDWQRTESESDTFYLPLQIAYDEYVFEVAAEDNEGLLDPTPANLRIPVANSAPSIEFILDSNPSAAGSPDVTHVTFPTRTFAWSVSDLDGLQTVNRIRYRLDSTSVWSYLDGNVSSVTLTGIPAGYHTFYVQAVDTAGAVSNLLQFPDSTDVFSPNYWLVREPQGEVLIMDDYANDNGSAHTFYTNLIDSLYGPGNYSIFEIGDDEKALPALQTDQVAMYDYFKTVVWYHFTKATHLDEADLSLRNYLENGGNLMVSSIYINPEYTFISIDSSYKFTAYDFLQSGFEVKMMDVFSSDPDAERSDTLATATSIPYPLFAYFPSENLEAGETSRDLFRLTEPRSGGAEVWTGYPPVAQLYQPTPSAGRCVFFSLPLHQFNANNNIVSVMDHVFFEIFQ